MPPVGIAYRIESHLSKYQFQINEVHHYLNLVVYELFSILNMFLVIKELRIFSKNSKNKNYAEVIEHVTE